MFTNYQWLIIGVIIACSCLVVYGSSSTNIKEGIYGRMLGMSAPAMIYIVIPVRQRLQCAQRVPLQTMKHATLDINQHAVPDTGGPV